MSSTRNDAIVKVSNSSLEETNQVRLGVIKVIQKEAFGDMMQARAWGKQPSLRRLCPVVTDDPLCIGGLLACVSYPAGFKH